MVTTENNQHSFEMAFFPVIRANLLGDDMIFFFLPEIKNQFNVTINACNTVSPARLTP